MTHIKYKKPSVGKTAPAPFPVDSMVQYKNYPGTRFEVVYVSGDQLVLKGLQSRGLSLVNVSEVESFISPEHAELRAEVSSALEECGRNADPRLAVKLADELWRRGVGIIPDGEDHL